MLAILRSLNRLRSKRKRVAHKGTFGRKSLRALMSDCCSLKGSSGAPGVAVCPVNGARSKQVDMLTVKSLVRQLPLGMPHARYYFCEAQDCDVVYFALDSQAPVFRRADLLVRVGVKETAGPIPVCYCFGFTRGDIHDEIAETGRSTIA